VSRAALQRLAYCRCVNIIELIISVANRLKNVNVRHKRTNERRFITGSKTQTTQHTYNT